MGAHRECEDARSDFAASSSAGARLRPTCIAKWPLAMVLLVTCVLLAASAVFASVAAARVLPILVMGDSYSAGNGAGDYFGAKGCWRSPNNYAGVFARALEGAPYDQPTVLDNVACSGDT